MKFLFDKLAANFNNRQRVTVALPGAGANPGMVKGNQFGRGSALLWTPDFHLIQTRSDAGNGTLVANPPRALSSTAPFIPLRMFADQQNVGTFAKSPKGAPLVDRSAHLDIAARR